MIYLDNSATTRQYDEVTDLMAKMAKESYGNPSSLHKLGFDAEKMIKKYRNDILNPTDLSKLVFTSCGTEADNMAIFGMARKYRRENKRFITSVIEHPAVSEAMKRIEDDGTEVKRIPVDSKGIIDVNAFRDCVNEETAFVSVMTVNNETGALQPIKELVKIFKNVNPNGIFHTDGVQAYGKMKLIGLDADMISISGHKFHGPKGMGALLMKESISLPPYILGGGQEGNLRSGTENTGGIAGLGLASLITYSDIKGKSEKLMKLNDYLYNGITSELDDVRLNGSKSFDKRCPAVLNLSFMGTRGEVILHTLEQDEIFVSTGSACSSNKKGDSGVLSAMGLSQKEIEGAIRFSLSEFNTISEMDITIDRVTKAVKRFRKLGSFR